MFTCRTARPWPASFCGRSPVNGRHTALFADSPRPAGLYSIQPAANGARGTLLTITYLVVVFSIVVQGLSMPRLVRAIPRIT